MHVVVEHFIDNGKGPTEVPFIQLIEGLRAVEFDLNMLDSLPDYML
jgi:hypothetical protein